MSLLIKIVCYVFLLSHLSLCFLIYRSKFDIVASKTLSLSTPSIQPQPQIPFRLLQLAKDVAHNNAKENNFVFSPASIQLALSLVATASTTLKEILTFLDAKDLNHLNSVAVELIGILTDTAEGGPKLSFVGGIWVDQSIALKPMFQSKAKSIYRANAKSVDFQNNGEMVIKEINKWAAEATNGLIKSILPPYLGQLVRVVLGNAIYVKGTWNKKFEKQYTEEFPFYLADGTSSVSAPFMSSLKDQYISTFDDFKVLRLPYEKGMDSKASLSMYIILPNLVNGIWSLIEKVGSDRAFFETHLRHCEEVEVRNFRIPKFKMEFEFEASKYLKNVGLNLPFTGEAEFDEIVEGGRLKVDKVHHRAYSAVDEEGTEAAAVTVIEMDTSSGLYESPPQGVDFVADHPFMFVVRDDKSGMILFMGHVINPSS